MKMRFDGTMVPMMLTQMPRRDQSPLAMVFYKMYNYYNKLSRNIPRRQTYHYTCDAPPGILNSQQQRLQTCQAAPCDHLKAGAMLPLP